MKIQSHSHFGFLNLKTGITVTLVAVLLFLLASVAFQISISTQQVINIVPLPEYTRHRHTEKHPEANEVRECTERGDSNLMFRHKAFENRFAWLCQLPDGRWGIHILELVGDTWEEVTAFVRDQAKTSGEMVEYLRRTLFTRYNGPLP
jgi:hypothetical protein